MGVVLLVMRLLCLLYEVCEASGTCHTTPVSCYDHIASLPIIQLRLTFKPVVIEASIGVIYKSTCPENYIPAVMPPLNPTSPPSMAATFLATRHMAVLQPSGYSVFHGGDTPIQLGLP